MDDDCGDGYTNMFSGQSQRQGCGPGGAFRSQSFNVHNQSPNRKRSQQDPPIEHDLYVSLEDVSNGTTKKMKITKCIMQPDGITRKEEKILPINVKLGWKAGTRVKFEVFNLTIFTVPCHFTKYLLLILALSIILIL